MAPTDPQFACSSMIQESKVTIPSLSGYPPSPTQQLIIPSAWRAPASTASKALPLADKTIQASVFTSFPVSQVETTIGFVCIVLLLKIPFTESKGAERLESCKNFLLFSILFGLTKFK